MRYMLEAISLAKLAAGNVSPNPAVGAVLVKGNTVIGRGYTQLPGSDHAEIVAIKQAGILAQGSTLYVTLEPCCHHGRTPPCTDEIIRSGIKKVNIATLDPNPLVSGKGKKQLEKAGIKTTLGQCEDEAKQLIEAFTKFITTGIPFITSKFAMSLDGKIATTSGDSKWISSEASRCFSHHLRHQHDAIMAGINTILKDNPQLTVRCGGGKGGASRKQPVRIIVDSYGRTPLNAQILNESGKTIIAIGESVSVSIKQSLIDKGAVLLELPVVNGFIDLKQLLLELGKMEITSIMVEGGSTIMGSMFDQGLVDKVVAFIAPVIIGGEIAPTPVGGQGMDKLSDALRLKDVQIEQFDDDVMVIGYARKM
jgi:diaminohydroxyphosphoribosylaminopyrimidine deaminase / 5-amino-6-(5-phosphoribosylamino)uracil reductase